MATASIEVERHGNVSILRMNKPEKLNAITTQMLEELDAALMQAAAVSRAVILTGAGRAFCSGAGLDDAMQTDDDGEPDMGAVLESHINPLMSRLRDLEIPWISAVRGAAAGVGCSMALAGDLIIASDTAYFLQAFVRIGIIPDGGSPYILARGASRVRAMEMMLLGEKIGARQALEWGLINRVVADDALDEAAMALAQRLANGPTRAYAMARKLAWRALDDDWNAMLAMERDQQRTAGRTRDAKEGIAAFWKSDPRDLSAVDEGCEIGTDA